MIARRRNPRQSRNARRFALAAGLATLVSAVAPARAVEEPGFTLVISEGDFELRDYAAQVHAETMVAGSRGDAAWSGFRILAGYIFGANAGQRKIEMTAPVVEIPADGGWTIRFTMPADCPLAKLPAPDDKRVALRAAAPARYAVVKFSGIAWDSVVADKTRALQGFVGAHKLRPLRAPVVAQYDPPWRLPFLRRNEVMIEVAR